MAQRLLRGFRAVKNLARRPEFKSTSQNFRFSTSYVSEMRKSAFEGTFSGLFETKFSTSTTILLRSRCIQPPPEFNSFKIDIRPGEQWIRLNRKFGENEDIKVEVTMFDGSAPIRKTDDSLEVRLHITLIVSVFKGENDQVLEFICSAWPDAINIRRVYTRDRGRIKYHPYPGPAFKELDDELQDSLYDFLEERGVDDSLAEFLHKYMKYKDKAEYLGWMGNLKSIFQDGQRNGTC